MTVTLGIESAGELLDLAGKRIDEHRAREQLAGAVALHNMLEQHGVAYLADEVGMGKTYVALGAMALFRHRLPDFRVLVLAPRENIQKKWMKEWRNFAANNVRVSDLRVRGIDGRPARGLVSCDNLLTLAREAIVDPDRDFFARMTSFSLGLGNEREDWWKKRDALRAQLPWLPSDAFDLRSKEEFKDNFSRALCCALPVFDLVIVDEAHNLKHGFSKSVAARNRVLGLALGRGDDPALEKRFPGYGPRARRVLFLSATPIEETYRHVWNQLDVLGFARQFPELAQQVDDDEKKAVLRKFLVRRVTSMRVRGQEKTKNEYRRDWRSGGVAAHDEPLRVTDPRQRLVVALVQKKVSELLGSEKFNASFQIGMLASFESFLETARVRRAEDAGESNFDDAEQTDDLEAREGIDVRDVNRLAKDYRKQFGREMPHPKMDAVAGALSDAWRTGRKSLVFVRRVASVRELKRKLDDQYDAWLLEELRTRLPENVLPRLDTIVRRYRADRLDADERRRDRTAARSVDSEDDRGGTDTFFAWFFRGDRAGRVLSGSNLKDRFIKQGSAYATFFEENHVAAILETRPGSVASALCRYLDVTQDALRDQMRARSVRHLSAVKRHLRGDRFRAAQATALELIVDHDGPHAAHARVVLQLRHGVPEKKQTKEPVDVVAELEEPTFFTELRDAYPELRSRLWPVVPPRDGSPEALRAAVLECELRAHMLASAARLGHPLIDLYVLAIRAIGSMEARAQEDGDESDDDSRRHQRIRDFLDLLQQQMRNAASSWNAFRELAAVAEHFDLILDVNAPELRNVVTLAEASRPVADLFRNQMPVGGMAGQVNATMVKQFRLPGYPFVLISTDLLQEGEDLHTFCSSIHHYGISWTPSSMEQRIGRIDRVRSETDRRLSSLDREPTGDDWLQVYYPHLEETVEVLQVDRVLDRMNTFLRLMHEGLVQNVAADRTIHVGKEMLALRKRVAAIKGTLKTAFPVTDAMTAGAHPARVVGDELADRARDRLARVGQLAELGGLSIVWHDRGLRRSLFGTARLQTGRQQPFALTLHSDGERLIIRCTSPIGRVHAEEDLAPVQASALRLGARVGLVRGDDDRSFDLTVEDDVLLSAKIDHDLDRVGWLVARVTVHADVLEKDHLDADRPIGDFADDLQKDVEDD